MGASGKLNDDQLDGVSGGAGKTKWGFPYDNNGTVTYSDKTGAKMSISAADWKWLLSQYNGPIGDPEYYLSTVPTKDLTNLLNDHHAGRR
ncbi:MAG: hypothetical protein K6G03_00345 [Lachnospiraceae bacterium]|nr:hypothetical protein [Lachnospiraceae bacterium]